MIQFLVFDDSIGCTHVIEALLPEERAYRAFCGYQGMMVHVNVTVVYTLPKDRRRLCRTCFGCFKIEVGAEHAPDCSINDPLRGCDCGAEPLRPPSGKI
jgi:hypothetical protein